MPKTKITGKPPRQAFRFAAQVQIGRGAKFSDVPKTEGEMDDAPKPEGELDDSPEKPPQEMDDSPPSEPTPEDPKPAEMADESVQPINVLARTGGVADQLFWGRCVHDFAGMQAPSVITIDYCHDPMQVIGVGDGIKVDAGALSISGKLISCALGDRASEVMKRSKLGTPYQASILMGWNDYTLEEIAAGETAEVNGQQIAGPVAIFRKWSLRGLAVCPYGSDAGTSIGFEGETPPEAELNDEPTPETALNDDPNAKPEGELDDEPAGGEVYLEEFGDRGGIYFAKGFSLTKARQQFAADLAAENKALKGDLLKAKGQLSAGTTPVTFQSAEPHTPGVNATPNLSPNMSRFALGLKIPKR